MTNTTHAKRSEDYLYGVDGRDPEGKVVVRRNATAVVAVIPDTQGVVRIDVGDREYFVLGNVHEITSLVFQAVAA
jgi:hypothetical protein